MEVEHAWFDRSIVILESVIKSVNQVAIKEVNILKIGLVDLIIVSQQSVEFHTERIHFPESCRTIIRSDKEQVRVNRKFKLVY